MLRHIVAFAVSFAMLGVSTAEARETGETGGQRPWGRGIFMPSIGLGAGFQPSYTQLSLSIGGSYFVAKGLALGLGVSDTIFIFSQDFRATYPGIEKQVATNMLRVMPNLRYVFWRNRRFSPYVQGGVGPVFLNHGGGTIGEWNAGPGAYIGLGGPVFLDLGVGFSARFPRETCDRAFFYDSPDVAGQVIDACSFRWGPRLGLVVAFGGSRSSRRRRRVPPPQRSAPQVSEPPVDEALPAANPVPAAEALPAAEPVPNALPAGNSPTPEAAAEEGPAPAPEALPAGNSPTPEAAAEEGPAPAPEALPAGNSPARPEEGPALAPEV